jgi:hypothetical protein
MHSGLKWRVSRWHWPSGPAGTVEIQKLAVRAPHDFTAKARFARDARVSPRPIAGARNGPDGRDHEDSERYRLGGEDRRYPHDRTLPSIRDVSGGRLSAGPYAAMLALSSRLTISSRLHTCATGLAADADEALPLNPGRDNQTSRVP